MAQKRKAACELQQESKRAQTSAISDLPSVIHADDGSDVESVASESYYLSERSDNGDKHLPTPVTPFSPASTTAKFPSDLKTHTCPYENCGKAFNRPARLSEHLRSHTNERIFNCSYDNCSKTFLRASHLNHHVKSAHTTLRDYVCDKEGCGKTFVTGSRLRRHLAAHEGRDKYRCTEHPPCNETFRKHSTLQRHVMMVHLNQKPFPCAHTDPATGNKCSQAFDTAGHLRAHEGRIHAGSKFICNECSKPANEGSGEAAGAGTAKPQVIFPTYALLQTHMRSVHPPTCDECNRICSSRRELQRHLEIAHGSVSLEERKVHPCNYPDCDRSFTKKGNLNVHIRTVHEGEKRFTCGETDLSTSTRIECWSGEDSCGKRYGSKLALEEHVRTAHLGFKNAKAARREQLGLGPRQRPKRKEPSGLAMLTGDGYAEETGRHIPCLIQSCAYRFHREYDLWNHMSAKHGLEENDIQVLFMQRAMEGGDQSFDFDLSMTHGFYFDSTAAASSGQVDQTGGFDDLIAGTDMDMHASYDEQHKVEERFNEVMVTNSDDQDVDMGVIDPQLTYPWDQ